MQIWKASDSKQILVLNLFFYFKNDGTWKIISS